MKVYFDISALGFGFVNHNGSSKAGIFRAIETLALSLINQEKLDLNLCAIESYPIALYAQDYLKSNLLFTTIPFHLPNKQLVEIILLKQEHKLNSIIAGSEGIYYKEVIPKALRKSVRMARRFFPTKDFSSFDPNILTNADIIHSTFYPLPQNLQSQQAQLFLTAFDLIPILHPEFFVFSGEHLVETAIKSLKPNNWALTISQATKDDLCNYRKDIDPAHVFVTHLAASPLFYKVDNTNVISEIKAKYNVPDSPYLLSLCTLEPRKNIDLAIRSFAQVIEQENISDLNLVLVGAKGWKSESIFTELEKQVNIKNRVFITGYVNDEDLAALYSGAMAFIYPSFYEGFGLPPLEAMQCGVPVITSNTSSLPEVVGDAAIMIDPKDGDALSDAILRIYNSPSLRSDMSERSLARAKKFSWAKTAEETVKAYRTAINS